MSSWTNAIDAILRGDAKNFREVRLGRTSILLRKFGLASTDLTMSAAKIATIRRTHPDVELTTLYALPTLLEKPLAIFPSSRRDGSIVLLLVVVDRIGHPVIVAATAGINGASNAILSVYGKAAGFDWVHSQIRQAQNDKLLTYMSEGFAASMPKPGSAKAIPSSPGPIPADGTTKPRRKILTIADKSTGS